MTLTPSVPVPVPIPVPVSARCDSSGHEPGTASPSRHCDIAPASGWTAVCAVARLTPGRGVAARVDERPVAIFWLGDDDVVAVDDVDPFTGVALMSRGLVGDVDGEPTVASPLYKQRFALRSGRCLDDEAVALRTWAVRIRDGVIEVGSA